MSVRTEASAKTQRDTCHGPSLETQHDVFNLAQSGVDAWCLLQHAEKTFGEDVWAVRERGGWVYKPTSSPSSSLFFYYATMTVCPKNRVRPSHVWKGVRPKRTTSALDARRNTDGVDYRLCGNCAACDLKRDHSCRQ
jgi:hypothetical protein